LRAAYGPKAARMAKTVVIGTGTWGTAMATACARVAAAPVVLWGRDQAKVDELAATRQHPKLADHVLDAAVTVTTDPAELGAADLVLWAVPTQYTAAMGERLAPHLPQQADVVSLSKGLEQQTLRRVSEILHAAWPTAAIGCLSGPSHAEEVMAALPAALVAAGPGQLRQQLVARIHAPPIRLYHSDDLVGVELGGALKNVIAIGAGICDGLQLGDNAKAALITRGVAEIRRLGRALGAHETTFAGLAGIGDLLATCYSPYGRNRALGLAVAAGSSLDEHSAASGMVAEGAWTCRAAVELGQRHGVELPIASQVASVLWSGTDVGSAIEDLLTRAVKEEDA